MELLNECTLLKIEDILPFFPDFVTIDQFKVNLIYPVVLNCKTETGVLLYIFQRSVNERREECSDPNVNVH